jgi:hypothetical protein
MKQISLICLLIAGLNSLNAQEKNNWTPEQTIKHKTINTVRVSPDGKQTVYVVRELKLIQGKTNLLIIYIYQVLIKQVQFGLHRVKKII